MPSLSHSPLLVLPLSASLFFSLAFALLFLLHFTLLAPLPRSRSLSLFSLAFALFFLLHFSTLLAPRSRLRIHTLQAPPSSILPYSPS
ncbi:hypothetical protein BC939DRAFT_450657 [Gamsiella multidivaricata]|uniref:uncharacterized protein n=1 Tax=Gamsiella multidivaricata TaxID=101098 RepID=UPI00221E3F41|nr:uncharacterized protein BC939DRAFT_450657 [Gamsiella multidivaricata]KAI7824122.1 hypothetical protein BC939DRAFT_450657 [Gamsiella multidivaricata]